LGGCAEYFFSQRPIDYLLTCSIRYAGSSQCTLARLELLILDLVWFCDRTFCTDTFTYHFAHLLAVAELTGGLGVMPAISHGRQFWTTQWPA
jgi:hypothetical protein